MSGAPRLIPISSQTVGPYFRIGLEHLIGYEAAIADNHPGAITLHGRVLDRDRAPVSDAMLEFWSAGEAGGNGNATSIPQGFSRAATDSEGGFSVVMNRPAAVPFDATTMQAPHMIVLVFARGLLRHLVARVYFDGDPENNSDPVLLGIAAERRGTLIARQERDRSYCWNVILQGEDETVFFAW
jgi:protocatechuate 3,4-dioxygenase, alpha subunit